LGGVGHFLAVRGPDALLYDLFAVEFQGLGFPNVIFGELVEQHLADSLSLTVFLHQTLRAQAIPRKILLPSLRKFLHINRKKLVVHRLSSGAILPLKARLHLPPKIHPEVFTKFQPDDLIHSPFPSELAIIKIALVQQLPGLIIQFPVPLACAIHPIPFIANQFILAIIEDAFLMHLTIFPLPLILDTPQILPHILIVTTPPAISCTFYPKAIINFFPITIIVNPAALQIIIPPLTLIQQPTIVIVINPSTIAPPLTVITFIANIPINVIMDANTVWGVSLDPALVLDVA
jgi:hypothetical protein